ncbi:hypothetical protein KGP36_03310 [Patescibacteria group bacterium]|nr:hypothetical protein [Patescibacteria group bacterium]
MGTEPNPIAGAGSGTEPIVPGIELDPTATSTVEGQGEGSQPDGDEGQPPKPGEGEGQGEGGESREDGRVIPQWMRALKDSNPEAYKRAKTDLFELRDRRSVHPTAQAAREEHEVFESLGGAEGVEKLQEEGQFFQEAAKQFLKGDPAFVKDLWEEDAIAAALHVQPMLDEFKARDLEGYKSTVARLWEDEFQGVGFGNALKALAESISTGNKETSLALVDGFKKWFDSIGEVARKAEDPRVKTLLADRARQQDQSEQAQQQEFLKSYRSETINTVVEEATKVFDSFFKNRKIDADDRMDLLRESIAIANRAVEADSSFKSQRDRHLERGDSQAARRLTKARFARELPEAVKRVARRYGLISGTPRQDQGNGQGGGRQQPAPRAPQGWVAVNERPTPEQINRSLTSNSDIISKRAVLKDGRKVTWAHLKA